MNQPTITSAFSIPGSVPSLQFKGPSLANLHPEQARKSSVVLLASEVAPGSLHVFDVLPERAVVKWKLCQWKMFRAAEWLRLSANPPSRGRPVAKPETRDWMPTKSPSTNKWQNLSLDTF